MTRYSLVIVLAVGVAAAVPSAVEAGTVRVESSELIPVHLIFEAALGEPNNLQLIQTTESSFTVIDSGAPLTALDGCVSSDSHKAICDQEAHVTYMSVRLRDLGDTALVTLDVGGPSVSVYGGGGGDRLTVRGAHSPQVYGGGGNDLIQLRNTRYSQVWGGGGDDRLEGGSRADVLYGGVGHDTLIGGGGDDVLLGGSGHDVLRGGPRRDVLYGGKGDDVLVGGRNLDWLFGHGGDDLILTRDGARDVIRGGLGRDRARLDIGLDRARGIEVLL